MGDFVELSHLTESLDGLPSISRVGSNRAGAEMLAGRRRSGGRRNEIFIGTASFVVDGERLAVRWDETWGGRKSRAVARGDVAGVDVEADDRSAAGRETAKVVVRLRDGQTFTPVRREDRGECETEVAELARALGLIPPAPTPPAPRESGPGLAYVSMAETGAGMRPIVEGGATLVGAAAAEGGVLIRLGEERPWLLVGADRGTLWARAVGLPAGWDPSLEVARAFSASDVFRVCEIPGTELEERAGGRRGTPASSGVWVEMRDGTRARVARRLPHAEAAAVVAELTRALALPSRRERSRAYLEERRAESAGGVGGVSGDAPAGAGARIERSAGGGGAAIVLPYAREPADAVRVIRGDGLLRVSAPEVPFWRGWIREVIQLLPWILMVGLVMAIVCAPRAAPLESIGLVVPAITLLWLGSAAVLAHGMRTDLTVSEGVLTLETFRLVGGRRLQWAVEDVLDVRGGDWSWAVTAIVRRDDGDGPGTGRIRREVRLLTWEGKAARRRVVEVLRAAVGLAPDPAEAGGGVAGDLK